MAYGPDYFKPIGADIERPPGCTCYGVDYPVCLYDCGHERRCPHHRPQLCDTTHPRWAEFHGKKKIATVVCPGCFDLLGPHHVRLLKAAAMHGDWLIVALNSDASVRRLKGPTRPIVPQELRAEMLLALKCVNEVIVFDEDTPERLLSELKPGVLCKGADWRGRELPEAKHAGRVEFVERLAGWSTTGIIEGLRHGDGGNV